MATIFDDDDEHLIEVPVRLPLVEIERLTRLVARAHQSAGSVMPPQATPATAERLAAFAGFLLSVRRRRDRDLAGIEFGEPSWDMILDLYIQHVDGRSVSVSNLCIASAVPQSTALRWIDAMACAGHFIRSPDPQDRRRSHVRLAPPLVLAVERLLTNLRENALAVLQ